MKHVRVFIHPIPSSAWQASLVAAKATSQQKRLAALENKLLMERKTLARNKSMAREVCIVKRMRDVPRTQTRAHMHQARLRAHARKPACVRMYRHVPAHECVSHTWTHSCARAPTRYAFACNPVTVAGDCAGGVQSDGSKIQTHALEGGRKSTAGSCRDMTPKPLRWTVMLGVHAQRWHDAPPHESCATYAFCARK